jgi:hypothetical protein
MIDPSMIHQHAQGWLFALVSHWTKYRATNSPHESPALLHCARQLHRRASNFPNDDAKQMLQASEALRILAHSWEKFLAAKWPNSADCYHDCAKQLKRRADFIRDEVMRFLWLSECREKMRSIGVDDQKAHALLEWMDATGLQPTSLFGSDDE